MTNEFDTLQLSHDFIQIRWVYDRFFRGLSEPAWARRSAGGQHEWTLRDTVAHLCALNSAGLQCVHQARQGGVFVFAGLRQRRDLAAYNRSGIASLRDLSLPDLQARCLSILDEAALLARQLEPAEATQTVVLPLYNRPVQMIETLGIVLLHTGLFHAAQVAEPAGARALWTHLAPDLRHRLIAWAIRAFSLLYHPDEGGQVHATWWFSVGGHGGGDWTLVTSPERSGSRPGRPEQAQLSLRFRDTDTLFKLLTRRLNLPLALATGRLAPRGDWRLFLSMDRLFRIDGGH